MNPNTLSSQSDRVYRFSPLQDRSYIRYQKASVRLATVPQWQRRDAFKIQPRWKLPNIFKVGQQASSFVNNDAQVAPNHDKAISSLYNTLQSDLQLRDETIDSSQGTSSKAAPSWLFAATAFVVAFASVAFVVMFQQRMTPQWALFKLFRRLVQAQSAKQFLTALSIYTFFKIILEPCINGFRQIFKRNEAQEDSIMLQLIKMVYPPMQFLLIITFGCSIIETIIPNVLLLNKVVFMKFVKSINALTFVSAVSFIALSFKQKIVHETTWLSSVTKQSTDAATQLRVDLLDKLFTVTIIVASFTMAMSAIGIEVSSFLTIGGFGSLVLGLAGKEILENMFNGFLIISSDAFKVGEEVGFQKDGRYIEGFTQDIGWYCTTIRSFSREVFTVPNSVFSKTVVLNVSRKNKEFRFYEILMIKLKDVDKISRIIQDMRRLMKQDNRVLSRLHRRVFMMKVQQEYVEIEVSFYLECQTRDMFLAIRQEFMIDFIGVIHRHGASLAEKKVLVESTGSQAPTQGNIMQGKDEANRQEQTAKEQQATDQSNSQYGNTNTQINQDYLNEQNGLSQSHDQNMTSPQKSQVDEQVNQNPLAILGKVDQASEYFNSLFNDAQSTEDFLRQNLGNAVNFHEEPDHMQKIMAQQMLLPRQQAHHSVNLQQPHELPNQLYNSSRISTQVKEKEGDVNCDRKAFDPLASDRQKKNKEIKEKIQKHLYERNLHNNQHTYDSINKIDDDSNTEYGKHKISSFQEFSKNFDASESISQEQMNQDVAQEWNDNRQRDVLYPEVIGKSAVNVHSYNDIQLASIRPGNLSAQSQLNRNTLNNQKAQNQYVLSGNPHTDRQSETAISWNSKVEAKYKALQKTKSQLQKLKSGGTFDLSLDEQDQDYYIQDIFTDEEVWNNMAAYNDQQLASPDKEAEDNFVSDKRESEEQSEQFSNPFKTYLRGMSMDYEDSLDKGEDQVILNGIHSHDSLTPSPSQSKLSDDSNRSSNGSESGDNRSEKILSKEQQKESTQNCNNIKEKDSTKSNIEHRKLTAYTIRQLLGLSNNREQFIPAHYGKYAPSQKFQGLGYSKYLQN